MCFSFRTTACTLRSSRITYGQPAPGLNPVMPFLSFAASGRDFPCTWKLSRRAVCMPRAFATAKTWKSAVFPPDSTSTGYCFRFFPFRFFDVSSVWTFVFVFYTVTIFYQKGKSWNIRLLTHSTSTCLLYKHDVTLQASIVLLAS